MPGHQHLLELKKTYAAYEPYIASISSRRSSASSCRSLSSLSATAQEKLHAALAGLEACTIEALLALCSALDVEGKRTEPDEKVQALVMQASLSMIRTRSKLRFWRREPVCAYPTSLQSVLGGMAWSVGGDMRCAFLQCVFALYSSPDLEHSGGVALTSTHFAMMWRVPGGVQLECNRHWAGWLEGRKVGLVDVLENEDLWDSEPFRSQSDVDRLLAFVDSRHCPFEPKRTRRRPSATQPDAEPATTTKQKPLHRLSTYLRKLPLDSDSEGTAVAHIDKKLAKRIMAALPSDECRAYVDKGMADPRVIAAAFAKLSIEFRHWA